MKRIGMLSIGWVNIEFFPGWKKIKQRRVSFVLGYLPMILWKNSTAIYLYGFLNRCKSNYRTITTTMAPNCIFYYTFGNAMYISCWLLLENLLLLNGLNSTTMITGRTYKILMYFILTGKNKRPPPSIIVFHRITLGEIEFVCIFH